jgi:hypothetical protein
MTKTPADNVFDDEDEFGRGGAAPEAADEDALPEDEYDADDDALDYVPDEDDAGEETPDDAPGDVIDGTEDEVFDDDDTFDDDAVTAEAEETEETETEDPAVAAAVRAVQQAVAKSTQRTVPTMAANQKPAKKTKAEYIREMIAHLKTKTTEPLRPRDVIAALAKKGVEVTAPQVSVTLRDYEAGSKPATTIKSPKLSAAVARAEKTKTEKPAKPATPPTTEVNRPAEKARGIPPAPKVPTSAPTDDATMRRLKATRDFVRLAGGSMAARELIDVYETLIDTAG